MEIEWDTINPNELYQIYEGQEELQRITMQQFSLDTSKAGLSFHKHRFFWQGNNFSGSIGRRA